MPYIMCFMPVNIEFRMTVNRDDFTDGDTPGTLMEEMLCVVMRGMTLDRKWGGLAIDTKISESEIDLITYADRAGVGVCTATIQYRYNYNDPRNPTPALG
jgi:hypothetical protein